MGKKLKTLRAWRLERDLTQAELAAAWDVTQSYIQGWETHYTRKSHRRPSPDNIERIKVWTNGEVTADSFSREAHDACTYTRFGDLRTVNVPPHERVAARKAKEAGQ